MTIITAGMTGAQFINALNNNLNYYNILHYGAVGNDSTDNTTAIQNAINAAAVSGGTVYVPAGIFKTNKLTTYYNVRILGDGEASVLKSIGATVMIESLYNDFTTGNGEPNGGLENIYLFGNSVGTIGYNTRKIYSIRLKNVYISHFTTGIVFDGSLIGIVRDCLIYNNITGIHAQINGATPSPNLVTVDNCRFMSNTTHAINWTDGSMIKLRDCDFELNGTNGNAATGSIYFKNNEASLGHIPSLLLDGCWFEQNLGTEIYIAESSGSAKNLNVIQNCHMVSTGTEEAIHLVGTNDENKLILRSSNIQDLNGITADGQYATIINDNSFVGGTITQSNSAKLYNVDITEVI